MYYMNNREIKQYNLSYLEELAAGDTQFIRNIVLQLITEIPVFLQEISIALDEKKWEEIAYLVHKFGSNLSVIGIDDIYEKVNRLEILSKSKTNLEEIPELVDILVKRCESAINSLKKDFVL
jgi:HPt (histidine-containing phosphotransfer) domain-containing protein